MKHVYDITGNIILAYDSNFEWDWKVTIEDISETAKAADLIEQSFDFWYENDDYPDTITEVMQEKLNSAGIKYMIDFIYESEE